MALPSRRSHLLVLLLLLPLATPAPSRFTNPVTRVDAPDPGVVRFGDTFYMVTTGGASGFGAFPIRTSTDLVHWQRAGAIFPTEASLPAWSDGSAYWAPELHRIATNASGRPYRAYYTVRNATGVLSIGVATAAAPEGPYVDSGKALVLEDVGAIDATFFVDRFSGGGDNGSPQYLIWKTDGNSVGEPCHIKIRRLDDDGTGFAAGSEAAMLLTNDQPWEGMVTEAPWVIHHAGEYFLFYSGSSYADSEYAVGVARSASITGPYRKACAPILSQYASDAKSAVRKFIGPGHCSVLTGDDLKGINLGGNSGMTNGTTASNVTVMVYHAWPSDSVDNAEAPFVEGREGRAVEGRVVLVDQVHWGADGWPRVGECSNPVTTAQPMPLSWSESAEREDSGSRSGAGSRAAPSYDCLGMNRSYKMQTSQVSEYKLALK